MARSLNRVTLLGNLGADPDHRVTPNGVQVCTLNMATSENYKDKSGEWQEKTDWHRVVLWNRLAEVANEYLSKGSKVLIEGQLQTRTYEDKQGVTKYITEVVGRNMVMLSGKSGSSGGGEQRTSESQPNYDDFDDKKSDDEFDDEVPF